MCCSTRTARGFRSPRRVSSGPPCIATPLAVLGNTVVVTDVGGDCVQALLTSLDPFEYTYNIGAAAGLLVELAPPDSIEQLSRYHLHPRPSGFLGR